MSCKQTEEHFTTLESGSPSPSSTSDMASAASLTVIEQKKTRKPNWTLDETERLVDLVTEKRLVLKGRFSPKLSLRDKKQAWADITSRLNACNPLVCRTEDEVTNKWFHVLSQSRKKIAAIRREYNQSGENLFFLSSS